MCTALAVLVGVVWAAPVSAGKLESGAEPGADGLVDAFGGSYKNAIPIAVPPFHGLEPRLALAYDSAVGNGLAGVGWRLAGISVIERASPGMGTPRYDGTDVYVLDGTELVPCAVGSVSPSCTTGGTHSTKIESYERIQFDATTNYWHITAKDGTRRTYWPSYLVLPTGPVFRWRVASVTDTSGNTVTYTGWTDGSADWYPDTVTYGDALVKLHYETRPDPLTFAIGARLGRTSYRLKTIEVKVGGTRARAYKLVYGTSAATGRSLLESVQMYGKDATLDASGTVTGGTALPATTMTYQSSAPSFPGTLGWPMNGYFSIDRSDNEQKDGGARIADFNGDGIADLAWAMYECKNGWYSGSGCESHQEIWLGTGTGYVAGPTWPTAGFFSMDKNGSDKGKQNDGGVRLADMNGDGKTDIVWALYECRAWFGAGCAAHFEIWLAQGSGTSISFVAGPAFPDNVYFSIQKADLSGDQQDGGLRLADMNGDGKTDLVAAYRGCNSAYGTGCLNKKGIWHYTDTGFVAGPTWPTQGFFSNSETNTTDTQTDGGVRLADMDGDGKTDVVWALWEARNTWYSGSGWQTWQEIWLGTGAGFVAGPGLPTNAYFSIEKKDKTGGQQDGGLRLGDVNGDGRVDLVWALRACESQYGTGCINKKEIWLYTGGAFAAGPTWPTAGYFSNSYTNATDTQTDGGARLADLDGDGRTDVLWSLYESRNSWYSGSGWQSWRETWLSRGTTFATGPSLPMSAYFSMQRADQTGLQEDGGLQVADMNGDGSADLAWALWEDTAWYGTPPPQAHVEIRLGRPGVEQSDLLTTLTSGIGGGSVIGYTPSSAFANTNNPPLVHAVTSVVTSDGRGGSSTTAYIYSGGLYDHLERRFLGFRWVKKTLPCVTGESQCPYQETWFRQDYGSVSSPERTDKRDGAGTLLAATLYEYVTNGSTVPYTSRESGRWEYVYASPTVYKRTFAGRTFDAYGQIVEETTYGDYDLTGDELTARFTYRHNPTAYLVGLPAVVDTFEGVGTGGALLQQTLVEYDGNTTWDAQPTLGRTTRTLLWHDVTNTYVSTSAEYDAWGNRTATVDELGARSELTFDATRHLYVTVVENPLLQTSETDWDPVCSVPTRQENANGQATDLTYDALCRLTRKDGPLGSFEARSYVAFGSPTTQHVEVRTPTADGTTDLWTRTYFDGLGRTWRTTSRGPAAGQDIHVDATHDARGQISQVSAPYYTGATPLWTTTTYDALDRVVRVTTPDGHYRTRSYGLWSVTGTDEAGHSETDVLDAYGRVVERQEPAGAVTQMEYSARGALFRVTDTAGNETTFDVDSLGRRTQLDDPDTGVWTYEHDAAGRETAHVDARGQRTEVGYDALGRRTSKTTLAGTGGATTVTWTYDQPRSGYFNVGFLTTATDARGTATFDHDAVGRRVRATRTVGGTPYTFTHGFDAGGRLLHTTFPDGDTLGTPGTPLGYDAAGRPRTVPGVVTDTTYAADGQVLSRTQANGTTTTWAYSPERGWITGITTMRGAATLQDLDLARSNEGQITAVTSPFADEGWSYDYDARHRLVAATNATTPAHTQTFAYDAIGNVTSNSRVGAYTYPVAGQPRPHAVTQAGASTYTYDANGNLTSGGGRTLTWDGENRATGIGGATFTYDADGARLEKTVAGTTTLYLGGDVEIAGGVVTKYIRHGAHMVGKRVGSTPYWLHADHLGSLQVMTDSAGLEVARQKYRPYGEVLAASGGGPGPRGFTGQCHDETGLVYLHARYYDPELARFVSPDPTVPPQGATGLNRYAYAANNPIAFSDTSGLEADGGGGSGSSSSSSTASSLGLIAAVAGTLGSLGGSIASAPAVGGIGPWVSSGAASFGHFSTYPSAYEGYRPPAWNPLPLLGRGAPTSAYAPSGQTAWSGVSWAAYDARRLSDMILLAAYMSSTSAAGAGAGAAAMAASTEVSSGAVPRTSYVSMPTAREPYVYGDPGQPVLVNVYATEVDPLGRGVGGLHVMATATDRRSGAELGRYSLSSYSPWILGKTYNDVTAQTSDYEFGAVGSFYMSETQAADFARGYTAYTSGHRYWLGDSNLAVQSGLERAGFPAGTAAFEQPRGMTQGYMGAENTRLDQRTGWSRFGQWRGEWLGQRVRNAWEYARQ